MIRVLNPCPDSSESELLHPDLCNIIISIRHHRRLTMKLILKVRVAIRAVVVYLLSSSNPWNHKWPTRTPELSNIP